MTETGVPSHLIGQDDPDEAENAIRLRIGFKTS